MLNSCCVKLNPKVKQLDHLIAHYGVVGGDGEVIKSAILVQKHLLGPVERLEAVLNSALKGVLYTYVL